MTENSQPAGTRLRLARQARGLSQQQLAGVAGITRQAVSAVEAGHSDPSLRVALGLARALGMTVEDLFGPGDPGDPVLARPAAEISGPGSRVALATVGDTFVALPLHAATAARLGFSAAGGLVAGGAVAGGAVAGGAVAGGVVAGPPGTPARQPEPGHLVPVRPIGPPRPTVVVAGCDPALPLLETPLALLDPPLAFAWWPCGSGEALRLAAAGLVHAAGVHHGDLAGDGPGDGPGNGPGNGQSAAGTETETDIPGGANVVGFASWREGLVVRPGAEVRGLGDVAWQGLRLVNREPGAQARTLLDRERLRLGLDPAELPGYDSRAAGHLQVAAAIVGGLADAGVSSEPAALAYGLGFVPLAAERFDLVLPAKHAASREVQGLLKVLASPWLLAQLASLPGYDAARCGERASVTVLSVPVHRDHHGPGDGVEAQVEARHGRRDLVVDIQRVHVQRVHREHVAVRRVPGRRGRAAEVLGPVVVAHVERPLGQAGAVRAGRVRLEFGHRGGNAEHDPVPETRTGRRVRVEAGDREALGLGRETGPAQRRGEVPAGHAEPVEDLVLRHHLAVGNVVTVHLERRDLRMEVVGEWRTVRHGSTSSARRTRFLVRPDPNLFGRIPTYR